MQCISRPWTSLDLSGGTGGGQSRPKRYFRLLQHVRSMLLQRWLLTLIFFRRHAAHFSISRSIGYERFFPRAGASKGKSILTHLQKQAVRDCQTPKLLMRQIFMIITTCIDLRELDCSVISAVFEGALPYRCELHEASLANIASGRPALNSPSHKLWPRRFHQLTKSSPAWWPPIDP
jgi:hypothetical protein